MKKLISFLFALSIVLATDSQGQVPQGIPYQAVARNTQGQPLANRTIKVRFTIRDSIPTGTVVFSETHSPTTTDLGLFSLNIGMGTPNFGSFSSINWGANSKFLKVEVDSTGSGSSYLDYGTQQMMSVPYALFANQSRYIDGYSYSNSIIQPSSSQSQGNFSIITGLNTPNFLRYYGNCSKGNKICVNNDTLFDNSNYCNLKIPSGTIVKVLGGQRTVIYVSDTLFLEGTVNGSGANASVSASNKTNNHVGATASHWNLHDCSSGQFQSYGTGNDTFNLTCLASQLPESFFESFDFSITKIPGKGFCCTSSCNSCSSSNGQDLTATDLTKLIHFGTNISGGNGRATVAGYSNCPNIAYGGQGGAGLYFIAKNIVFSGNIILNGGNGTVSFYSCGIPTYQSASAGGGGGSCIISTENLISQTGSFQSVGGTAGYSTCSKRGGNGAMIIVKN